MKIRYRVTAAAIGFALVLALVIVAVTTRGEVAVERDCYYPTDADLTTVALLRVGDTVVELACGDRLVVLDHDVCVVDRGDERTRVACRN